MTRKIGLFVGSLVLGGAVLVAQGYSPEVTMNITLPDGQTKTLSVHESGTATLTTADGTEYGFRPTMLDDQGMRDTITIFKMGTKTAPVSVLGDVEVRLNAPAVAAKTMPVFKVAVTKIDKSKKLM